MTLHDRATSADMALHTARAEAEDARAHEAMIGDVIPAETRIEEWKRGEPEDTREMPVLDFDGGMLRRVHDPEGRAPHGAFIFPAALIVCIAAAATFAIRFL